MNDDFLFAEDEKDTSTENLGSWKILIVDDEPEVHTVTKLVLNDFILNGKTIEFISANSGEEAKAMFREHNDIAVVLLDVVMETDDAGLQVANYVRNELDNHFTRIILRTGQPGQAPEKDVIINYDIKHGFPSVAISVTYKDDLFYKFAQDAYYTESKNQEILRSRVEVLNGMASYIGTLFSKSYVQRNVLMLTDEEISQIESDLALEQPFITQDQQHQMNMAQQDQEAQDAAPVDTGE